MKITEMSKNIPVNLNELPRMINAEMKHVTRTLYRDQIAKQGIVIFTSRTAAHVYFCSEQELLVAVKNTKFFRLQYVTFTID